jgi:hypothetical protein
MPLAGCPIASIFWACGIYQLLRKLPADLQMGLEWGMAATRDSQISWKSVQSSKFSETDTVEFRCSYEPEPYSTADLDQACSQLPGTVQFAAPSVKRQP